MPMWSNCGWRKSQAGEANAHLGEVMEGFLEKVIPKLTLEQGAGVTQSGDRRCSKQRKLHLQRKARPHQGPSSNRIKVRHNLAPPTRMP